MLAILGSGIASSMMVELAPCDGPRTFDVQNDLTRMVCGRSAAALAIRLRWVCVVICILAAVVPVLLIFAVHWASGGLGQFALAYEWPSAVARSVDVRGMVAFVAVAVADLRFDAARDRLDGDEG